MRQSWSYFVVIGTLYLLKVIAEPSFEQLRIFVEQSKKEGIEHCHRVSPALQLSVFYCVTSYVVFTYVHGLDEQRNNPLDFEQHFCIIDIVERLRYEIYGSVAHRIP